MVMNTNCGIRLDVTQLDGHTLDFYVALTNKFKAFISHKLDSCVILVSKQSGNIWTKYNPSTLWTHGGPLVEKEGISLENQGKIGDDRYWAAYYGIDPASSNDTTCYGPTPLIAAMRCFVREEFGNLIDPEEFPTLEEK
jgi:hypothetical protein